MIDENRLIELLEDEILRIDTESTPGCGNLYGRDASVMKNTLNFVIDLINEQPKVGEWIPVEEREPSCSCMCLTWVKAKTTYRQYEKCVLSHYYDGFFDVFPYIDDEPNEVQILAWMLLPEPFKGD